MYLCICMYMIVHFCMFRISVFDAFLSRLVPVSTTKQGTICKYENIWRDMSESVDMKINQYQYCIYASWYSLPWVCLKPISQYRIPPLEYWMNWMNNHHYNHLALCRCKSSLCVGHLAMCARELSRCTWIRGRLNKRSLSTGDAGATVAGTTTLVFQGTVSL